MIPRTVLLFVVLVALSLGSGRAGAAEVKSTQASLNDGYSLFYQFCEQESQLSRLLLIKTTPPRLVDYIRRISTTARDDMATLKKFEASHSLLHLDKVSLPQFEINVRQSMDVARSEQLIWKNSGAAFVQAVCMTQSEATNYGMHVAKILAEMEPNPKRARAMRHIFDKWSALHAEAYQLGALRLKN